MLSYAMCFSWSPEPSDFVYSSHLSQAAAPMGPNTPPEVNRRLLSPKLPKLPTTKTTATTTETSAPQDLCMMSYSMCA